MNFTPGLFLQDLKVALRSLYRAKRNGKDQVQAWGRPPSAQPADETSARTATLVIV